MLRVLANLLGISGFEFQTSQEVLAQATNATAGEISHVPAALLNNKAFVGINSAVSVEIPEPVVASIYQLDGIVRRAISLQLTADARLAREGAGA